jgi:prolipoprotein diacylglyceryltransferase
MPIEVIGVFIGGRIGYVVGAEVGQAVYDKTNQ